MFHTMKWYKQKQTRYLSNITLLRTNTDIMVNQREASIHIFTSLLVDFSHIQTMLLSIAVLRDWFLNIPHFPNFSVNVWDLAWKLVGMVWTVGRWRLRKKLTRIQLRCYYVVELVRNEKESFVSSYYSHNSVAMFLQIQTYIFYELFQGFFKL